MDCHATRDVLEEYRRGELPADRARAVEAHLAGCPACRALREADDALAALIRRLPRTPAPAALGRQVRALGTAPGRRFGWPGRPWVAVALAALLLAAVLAPWVRRPATPPGGDVVDALILSGVSEHRRILLALQAGDEVRDPDVTFQRLQAVTEVPLPKALEGIDEVRLVAARPTLLASRKTVAATLQYKTAPVTTYFVLAGKDLPMPAEGRVQIEQYRPHMREVGEFNVIYWKQQDLAYLMVSGLDRDGCQKLYLKMRRAL
jgi:anti-sigma factor RsiW